MMGQLRRASNIPPPTTHPINPINHSLNQLNQPIPTILKNNLLSIWHLIYNPYLCRPLTGDNML
jgi:hypothetical protein